MQTGEHVNLENLANKKTKKKKRSGDEEDEDRKIKYVYDCFTNRISALCLAASDTQVFDSTPKPIPH